MAGCYGGPQRDPEPGTVCEDGTVPRPMAANDPMADFLGTGGLDHPLTAYDLGCDEETYSGASASMWCMAQTWFFGVTKATVSLTSDIMEWALSFDIADVLGPVATALSDAYSTALIGPIRLRHLAWTVTIFVFGLAILRGNTSSGVRELATTALIFIFGSMLIANPDGYLDGARELAQNSSGSLLQSVDETVNQNTGDPEELRGRLSRTMQQTLVAGPYDLLNWGEPLTGTCAETRDEILLQGPWGSSETPRQMMRDAGCDAAADYNAVPSDNRALGALTLAIVAVIVGFFLMSLALVVLVAQVTFIVLIAIAPLAWTVGMFPGGRGMVWTWVGRLVSAVVQTIAAMFLISFLAVTAPAILGTMTDLTPQQRLLIMLVIVFALYKLRGAIDKGLSVAEQRIPHVLNRAQTGKGGPLPEVAPRSGPMSMSLVAAGATAAIAARSVGQRAGSTVGTARHAGGRALSASQAAEQRARQAGSKVATGGRTVGRAAAGAAMIPVTGPRWAARREAERQGLRTAGRGSNIRQRLDKSRQTRQEWRRNIAHPRRATREAKENVARQQDARDWM